MKIAFAGTPEFARVALAALLDAGADVSLVLTQPDRPAGRGMSMQPSAVKQLAESRGIGVFQPATLRDPEAQAYLREARPDVMVVAAYGLILPQVVLDIPRYGCINIHASLLPRWRGAAPIQRAILAGDQETGVCIMRMEAGLDTGPVLLRGALSIGDQENASSLHDRLADLGGRLIVEALGRLETLIPQPQPEVGVTYAAKLDKAEAPLDFRCPAAALQRQVRAFDPFPGATLRRGSEAIKVWKATTEAGMAGAPGKILAVGRDGVVIACGDGALRIVELQKPGGRRLPVAEALGGLRMSVGEQVDLPAG